MPSLPVPVTPLMVVRLVEGYGISKDWVSYEKMSPNLARAAIASEDSGFLRASRLRSRCHPQCLASQPALEPDPRRQHDQQPDRQERLPLA